MMRGITAKKRAILKREVLVLEIARRLLLKGSYHGLTMARIAEEAKCSKGTVYEHFTCKEEIIVALATASFDKQRALVERAATFRGRPRERMVAVGEATRLFALLYTDDSRIFQIMNGEAITQKLSEASLTLLRTSANVIVGIMSGIVRDAIAQGDLTPSPGMRPEDLIFHFWLIGESGKAVATSWLPPFDIGIEDPFDSILCTCEFLADGFGWHPLSNEWDYKETRRRIMHDVFPKEAMQVYGKLP